MWITVIRRITPIAAMLFAAGLAMQTPRADAQVLYGSIVGTVLDRTGSMVPNASVRIMNSATGQSRDGATTDQGSYTFVDLLPGAYSVTIGAKGFRTYSVTGVQVIINTVSRVDAQLQVGEQAEAITVSADVNLVQTDSADVH